MDRPVRIGLAGIEDRRLLADVRALPMQPEVHTFDSIYGSTEAVVALRPDVLFAGVPDRSEDASDLVGALRLLHSLLPEVAVVAVAAREREVALATACRRAGAWLLLLPYQPGELACALHLALSRSDRPPDDVFLDLARGFADEINNPLLFLMGHLQLLQTHLDPVAARDQKEQLDSALVGAQRIQATVDRVRLLAQAAAGPRSTGPVDLHAELLAALARLPTKTPQPVVLREPEGGDFRVPGDVELLLPALDLLVRVASELAELGCSVHFTLTRLDGAVRLRLSLSGAGLDDWRLPRTYEPYYLNRLLRGSSQGLSLFVVQAAVHGHRGQATARRLPDGTLALDLHLLPA
jgi:signal transduction histidine kinase